VAFIAVGSEVSLAGGSFELGAPQGAGPLRGGHRDAQRTNGNGLGLGRPAWARGLGPAAANVAPLLGTSGVAGPGTAPLPAEGAGLVATVEVEVSSSGPLGRWLTSGRHAGFSFAGRLRAGTAKL
jgi:hypothetical protein